MISFWQILKWKGFPMEEAQHQHRQLKALNRHEKKQWVEDQKNQIVSYHLQHNPFYKNIVGRKSGMAWTELPVMHKEHLQRPLPELLSTPYQLGDVYVANTSGSSGHPFFFAKDKLTHALTWTFIRDSYENLGITYRDQQARFYGIPLDTLSYVKEKIKDYFMNRIRFPVFDMGEEKLGQFFEKFSKLPLSYVYGYTNSILLFANYLVGRQVVLREVCQTLKICIVTSEVCTEDDKATIKKAFGVPVVREYGASELDVIAIEDQAGRWSINDSNLFVEVLSENDKPLPFGEEGRLVITSLHNRAMPFIRYDIGDVGILQNDDRGITLKKLSGRVNDTIILPSGKKSPGLTFYYVSRSILESSGILKEFIIRQTTLDSFEFDVISDRALAHEEIEEIRQKMNVYLEPGLKLKINRVEKIVRPASGKIKHFYSELKK